MRKETRFMAVCRETIHPIIIAVTVLITANTVSADQLQLASGDRLSGTLKNIAEGHLNWNSPVLGKLKIKLEQVVAVQSDQPFQIKADFGLQKQCLLRVDQSRQLLECQSGVLALDDWSTVTALAEKLDVNVNQPAKTQKTGEIRFALENSSGNTDKANYDLDSSLVIKKDNRRHSFGFELENDETNNQKTKDEWEVNYVYDYFVTDQWFISANTSYEEDNFRDLEYKIDFGLGAGYQFLQTSTTSLASTLGVVHVKEEATDGTKTDSTALRATVDYTWSPFDGGIELYHRSEFINAFSGESYYLLESLTGVSLPISGRLHSVFEFDYDYNSEPAAGQASADRKWLIGARYKW